MVVDSRRRGGTMDEERDGEVTSCVVLFVEMLEWAAVGVGDIFGCWMGAVLWIIASCSIFSARSFCAWYGMPAVGAE